MSYRVQLLTKADYEEKLKYASGVLLFYKNFCPNCRALEKVLEKFFTANCEVNLFRINSDESSSVLKSLGVERVPTVWILREGSILVKKVGLMNLREMTEFYLSANK
jgi:thioredoxin 1